MLNIWTNPFFVRPLISSSYSFPRSRCYMFHSDSSKQEENLRFLNALSLHANQLRKINDKIPNLLHVRVWNLSGITVYAPNCRREQHFQILPYSWVPSAELIILLSMSVKTASTDNSLKDLDFLVFSGSPFPLYSSKGLKLPFTSLKVHYPFLYLFFLCFPAAGEAI